MKLLSLLAIAVVLTTTAACGEPRQQMQEKMKQNDDQHNVGNGNSACTDGVVDLSRSESTNLASSSESVSRQMSRTQNRESSKDAAMPLNSPNAMMLTLMAISALV